MISLYGHAISIEVGSSDCDDDNERDRVFRTARRSHSFLSSETKNTVDVRETRNTKSET